MVENTVAPETRAEEERKRRRRGLFWLFGVLALAGLVFFLFNNAARVELSEAPPGPSVGPIEGPQTTLVPEPSPVTPPTQQDPAPIPPYNPAPPACTGSGCGGAPAPQSPAPVTPRINFRVPSAAPGEESFAASYHGMAAGDTRTSYIELVNIGNTDLSSFSIQAKAEGPGPLLSNSSDGLVITVERSTGGTLLGNTKVADLINNGSPLNLGAVSKGETVRLVFKVSLPQGSTAQNQSAKVNYTVSAVSKA